MHHCLLALALLFPTTVLAQDARSPLPDGVSERRVEIWSEGTRMVGDLYEPTELEAGARIPAIVMSHGWGGTKEHLRRYAPRFAELGILVLAFDYRGWGESDGRLVVDGAMPERDSSGLLTVRATEVRDVIRVRVHEDRSVSLSLLFDPEHNLEKRIIQEQFLP